MRELGFSEKWPKLKQDFTTFRFQRRDKDWQVSEVVRLVFKPRTKEREVLGLAKIIGKEKRWVAWEAQYLSASLQGEATVSDFEATEDGFTGVLEMVEWMAKTHKDRNNREPMNKLTLEWVKPKRVVYLLDGKPQIAEVGGHPWGYEGDIAKDEDGKERIRVLEVLEWERAHSPVGVLR